MQEAPRLPLTERCLHYNELSEVPEDIKKYWQQRYSIFEWYDHDIRLTHDAWFGVTPEPVANKIADHLSSWASEEKDTVVDIFGGVGGNAIAFALSERWARVIAVEKDADTLACAQHNAEVYDVGDWITWVSGDCFDFLAQQQQQQQRQQQEQDQDQESEGNGAGTRASPSATSIFLPESLALQPDKTVIFASPPWGGVDYGKQDVFDLSTMQPYNLATLHAACWQYDHLLYLPRTSDIKQIAKLIPKGWGKIDVTHYCIYGASKAMVAYLPAKLPTRKSLGKHNVASA
ncbi:hypothetical protein RB595_009220 [Gaeumannomyces hyphopodioides]